MSIEKQIEEMANEVCIDCKHLMKCSEILKEACAFRKAAEVLYNAGYRKQEWISVEERLPDRQGYFLITDEAGGVMVALWMKQLGWISNFSANKITHWMPLPEPPKMKGGE